MKPQFDDSLFTYCNAVDAMVEEKYAGKSFLDRDEGEALRDIAFIESAFLSNETVEECAFMLSLAWCGNAPQA